MYVLLFRVNPQSLAPPVETTMEKKQNFYCTLVSRFMETGRLFPKRFTTESKEAKD
jgi:hypothetical protein